MDSDDDDSDDDDQSLLAGTKKFSDENATWLKAKNDQDFDMDDSSDEETAIEKRARLQDQKIKRLQKEAEEELKTNITDGEQLNINDEEDIQDLQDIQRRIQEIIGTLNNFAENRDKNLSRKEYLTKVIIIIVNNPSLSFLILFYIICYS